MNNPLALWHEFVANPDSADLRQLLADDAVFHSPVVHTPQRGQALVALYLTAAGEVLLQAGDFTYLREVVGERDAVLEFSATVDGIVINGVDMIHWNEHGQIDDFKVMVRPLKAINLLHQKMAAMLQAMQNAQQ